MRKTGLLFVGVCLVATVSAVHGQGRILRGADVTVDNLVEALAPGSEALEPVKTRGIKPTDPYGRRVNDEARKSQAGKGSASLLMTFETNSSAITHDTKAMLDVVATALKSDKLEGAHFTIEGHADPRGNPSSNMRLSRRRAESVVNYLVARHHIPAERLAPVGKGSTELVNKARPDAPENRRVTIRALRP